MNSLKNKLAIAATVAVLAFPLGASLTMAATTSPTSALDGATLYSANCAGCHNALTNSDKKGATVGDIQQASNKMNISSLSVAQLQAIENALSATPTPVSTPASTPVPAPTQVPTSTPASTSAPISLLQYLIQTLVNVPTATQGPALVSVPTIAPVPTSIPTSTPNEIASSNDD